jgi:hypothetical protein
MKLSIFAMLFSLSAFAYDPQIFTGKYSLLKSEKCEMGEGSGGERAYVYVKKEAYYKNRLSINFDIYGEEATGDSFLIENGTVQTPGTSVDVHGKVTDTYYVNWVNAKKLIVAKVTKRPSMNFQKETIYTLSLKKDILTLDEKVFPSNENSEVQHSVCQFKKN